MAVTSMTFWSDVRHIGVFMRQKECPVEHEIKSLYIYLIVDELIK